MQSGVDVRHVLYVNSLEFVTHLIELLGRLVITNFNKRLRNHTVPLFEHRYQGTSQPHDLYEFFCVFCTPDLIIKGRSAELSSVGAIFVCTLVIVIL